MKVEIEPIDHHDMIEKSSKLGNDCAEALNSEDAYTIGEIKQLIADCEDFLIENANYLESME